MAADSQPLCEDAASRVDFVSLEHQITAEFGSLLSVPGQDKVSSVAFLVAIVSAIAALLFSRFSSSHEWAAVSALVALILEILGALVMSTRFVWGAFRSLKNNTREFAQDTQSAYLHHQRLYAWLQAYPIDELRQLLRFTIRRREQFADRLGLLGGGMERLGALPMLVGLYLQFKDVQLAWPLKIQFIPFLMGGLILALYVIGWWGASWRMRLKLYEHLLTEAIARQTVVPPQAA